MPRTPRVLLTGFPHHVVQRGHNGCDVFTGAADFEYYLANVLEWKRRYDIQLYAWALMTNHVHLVLVPRREGNDVSRFMRRVSARHCRHLNRREARTGTLWGGRFRSSVVDTDRYLLACLRYVELNPVRAGLVFDPAAYRWSSYRERMGLAPARLLDPDPVTPALGSTMRERRDKYADMLRTPLDDDRASLIRNAVRRNQLTGDESFVREIARQTGVHIRSRGRGRPRQNK